MTGRFWERIEQGSSSECWPWLGPKDKHGYGKVYVNRTRRGALAHVVAYEMAVGSVPEGMQLDHLCHTSDPACPGGPECPHRHCVNPAHLELVTSAENTRRGRSFSAQNARKTHCAAGHPFDPANTYVTSRGSRACRTCGREFTARYLARRAQRTVS